MNDELKNKAYLLASRLKHRGYDNEVIRARLEKEGIPEELIKQVLTNLTVQKIVEIKQEHKPFYNLALLKIGIGIFLAIASAILIPGHVYIPIGLIAGGIAAAIFFKDGKKL
ncbi:hypothetical protein [Mucilaginibacter flavus]|uniref:hypothetical protein n=1 Tax=Mucilaginibacter flavus TaxID=931504 RepID=UPI0025B5DF3A|nr:hypothetical protein [Mucilaginibacter flavus]MDN3579659.1 hypothetical protein [Mucilaginibacter flavus]